MEMFDVRESQRRCGVGGIIHFWETLLFQANDTGVFAWVKFPEHRGQTNHIVIRYQFGASCLWYSELRLTTMLRMPSLNP